MLGNDHSRALLDSLRRSGMPVKALALDGGKDAARRDPAVIIGDT